MELKNLSPLAPVAIALLLMDATPAHAWADHAKAAMQDRAAEERTSKKSKDGNKDDEKKAGKEDPDKKSKDSKKGDDQKDKKDGKKQETQAAPGGTADCRIGTSSIGLAELPEASGLALSRRTPGILWSHVDSGAPVLFALDTRGVIKGKVRVEGVKTNDWEDVAVGPCGASSCVFMADIGDNQTSRSSITVYRVPEPLPTDQATRAAEAFHATFPDGPQDAEAMFVSGAGEIFIVTKGESGPIALYRFPSSMKPGGSGKLQKLGALQDTKSAKNHWITGASASPDGKWVALRTHGAVYFHDAGRMAKGDLKAPLVFDVTSLKEPRGEGVAFGPDGSLFLVGEGGKKGAPGTFGSLVCKLP